MIPNKEMLLTLLQEERPCKGIFVAWSIRESSRTWNITSPNSVFCTWDGVVHKPRWGEEWLESSPAERHPEVLMDSRLKRHHTRGQTISWSAQNSVTSQPKEMIISLSSDWCSLTLSPVCSFAPHHLRRIRKCSCLSCLLHLQWWDARKWFKAAPGEVQHWN